MSGGICEVQQDKVNVTMIISLDSYTQIKYKYLKINTFNGDKKARLVWGSNQIIIMNFDEFFIEQIHFDAEE